MVEVYPLFKPYFYVLKSDEDSCQIRAGDEEIYTINGKDIFRIITFLKDISGGINSKEQVLNKLTEWSNLSKELVVEIYTSLQKRKIILESPKCLKQLNQLELYLLNFNILPEEVTNKINTKTIVIINYSELAQILIDQLVLLGFVNTLLVDKNFSSKQVKTITIDELNVDNYGDFVFIYLFRGGMQYNEILEFNRFAIKNKITWTFINHLLGYTHIIGPLMKFSDTGCYKCFEQRIESNLNNPAEYSTFIKHLESNPLKEFGCILSQLQESASILVLEIMKYLFSYAECKLINKCIFYNHLEETIEFQPFLKVPSCEHCQNGFL